LASYRSQITCISLAKLERSLKEAPCQAVSHAAAAPPTCHETPPRCRGSETCTAHRNRHQHLTLSRVPQFGLDVAVSTDSHTLFDSGHHPTAIQPNRNSCKQESSLSDHPSGYQTKLKQQFDRGIGSTAIPTRKAILSLSPSFHHLPLRFASLRRRKPQPPRFPRIIITCHIHG
jgi:hypothetical protein